MGKSTAGELLRQRGVAVVDTDILARQLVEPGQPALLEIQGLFGEEIILPDGQLRRDELAKKVFADAVARKKLEAILHPPIRALWLAETQRWREQGRDIGVVIIPLLFETGAAPLFDATICIACSTPSQWQRLRERGWSSAETKQRLDAQWPTEKKIAQSDFVIWTETTLEIHAAQLERLLQKN